MLQDYDNEKDVTAEATDMDDAGFYEDLDSPATDSLASEATETDRTPRFGEDRDDLVDL